MQELELVPYLLYEKEDNGILWIKLNRPDRLNAAVGGSERTGTLAKVGEYMRAGDDDPEVKVIVLTGVGRGFCAGVDVRGADLEGFKPGELAKDVAARLVAAAAAIHVAQRLRERAISGQRTGVLTTPEPDWHVRLGGAGTDVTVAGALPECCVRFALDGREYDLAVASDWKIAEPLAMIRQAPSPLSDRQKNDVSVSTAVR